MAKSRREDERFNSELKRRHGLAIDEMDDNERRWARRKGGGARYETVELIVSSSKFDGEVLALDIAAFLQTLPGTAATMAA